MDWLVKIAIALAVLAAVTGAKMTYDHGQRKIGYNTAVEEYAPVLANAKAAKEHAIEANKTLKSSLDALAKVLAGNNELLDKMAHDDSERAAHARATILAASSKMADAVKEAQRLRQIAANPTISRNDCEEAFGIIDGVLARRLSNGEGGAAANDGRPAIGRGEGARSGGLPGSERRANPAAADPRDAGHGIEEAKGSGSGR